MVCVEGEKHINVLRATGRPASGSLPELSCLVLFTRSRAYIPLLLLLLQHYDIVQVLHKQFVVLDALIHLRVIVYVVSVLALLKEISQGLVFYSELSLLLLGGGIPPVRVAVVVSSLVPTQRLDQRGRLTARQQSCIFCTLQKQRELHPPHSRQIL